MTRTIGTATLTAIGLTFGAALASSVAAQPVNTTTDSGITVYGQRLPPGEPQELSKPVSFRDLDLKTDAGVRILQERVTSAAADLCQQLGEPEERAQNTTVLPSCQAAARGSAAWSVRRAVASARGQQLSQR